MALLRAGLCPALSESVVTSLKKSKIRTVVDFLVKDVEDIAQTCGIPYKDLLVIRRVLLAQYSGFAVNGADVYNSAVSSMSILSTGCKQIDDLLDGGLYTAEVTEVAGELASGKTQFCLTCAAVVSADCCKNVLYIDTQRGFSVERLQEIIQPRGKDQDNDAVLKRIRCATAIDIFDVLSELENTRFNLSKQNDDFYGNLKLLILDNVASVIYPILGGQQVDGHGLMVQLSQKLKQLAVNFSLAVLVINNILVSSEDKLVSLGRTWSYVPHTRVILSNVTTDGKQLRELSIVKSSRQKTLSSTAVFCISEKGLDDC